MCDFPRMFLQILRALRLRPSTQMLSDILSRLVETVAEQGDDMQVGFGFKPHYLSKMIRHILASVLLYTVKLVLWCFYMLLNNLFCFEHQTKSK